MSTSVWFHHNGGGCVTATHREDLTPAELIDLCKNMQGFEGWGASTHGCYQGDQCFMLEFGSAEAVSAYVGVDVPDSFAELPALQARFNA